MAHLDACRNWEILRGLRCLYDRGGVAIDLARVRNRVGTKWANRCRQLGILIGAVGLGGMSDRYGRKPMFIIEMIIFVAFLMLLVLAGNFLSLIICLFGIGLALGCDYPTAHMIIFRKHPKC